MAALAARRGGVSQAETTAAGPGVGTRSRRGFPGAACLRRSGRSGLGIEQRGRAQAAAPEGQVLIDPPRAPRVQQTAGPAVAVRAPVTAPARPADLDQAVAFVGGPAVRSVGSGSGAVHRGAARHGDRQPAWALHASRPVGDDHAAAPAVLQSKAHDTRRLVSLCIGSSGHQQFQLVHQSGLTLSNQLPMSWDSSLESQSTEPLANPVAE